MTTRRGRLVRVLLVLAIFASVVPTTAVDAQGVVGRPVLSQRFVSEAPDFASGSLQDPWDFSTGLDIPDVDGLTVKGFSAVETAKTADGKAWQSLALE